MAEMFALTRDDWKLLQGLLDRERSGYNNPRLRSPYPTDQIQPPQVLEFRTPDTGIPGLAEETGTGIEDTPGSAECNAYRLIGIGSSAYLVPLPNRSERVYNLSHERIGGNRWIRASQDMFGRWIADTSGLGDLSIDDTGTGTGLDDGDVIGTSTAECFVIPNVDASEIHISELPDYVLGYQDNCLVLVEVSTCETEAGSGGVTDHGELTGLTDDDHAQYALLDGRSGGQTLMGGTDASDQLVLASTSDLTHGGVRIGSGDWLIVPELGSDASTPPSGQVAIYAVADELYMRDDTGAVTQLSASGASDHGALTGLGDDDHSIYALLAGRAGGQDLHGGTGSGETLTLDSTSNATKGGVVLAAGNWLDIPLITTPGSPGSGFRIYAVSGFVNAKDSSGTIYPLSLPQLDAGIMEAETAGNYAFNPSMQHRNPRHTKAWVNFTGSGTVTINADVGVSSIDDNATGNYDVNWDTSFSSASYAVSANAGVSAFLCWFRTAPFNVGFVHIGSGSHTASIDADRCCVIAWGDL